VAVYRNFDGTMKEQFSLGKGTNRVDIRSDSGVLQGRNNGGAWTDLISTDNLDIEAQSSNFTAAYGKTYIVSNNVDIQLPAPAANRKITVKLASNNSVNLLRNGSEQIDFVAATKVLNSEKMSVDIITNGTDWYLI
jgi:hypothetical protein